MSRLSAREGLVDAALEVFYAEGFHASGIERVLEAANISRTTLYRHFKSKDELILAALEERDRRYREWLSNYITRASDNPAGRLKAVFRALELWIMGEAFPGQRFTGCMFVNAAAEYADHEDAGHKLAARHKLRIIDSFEKLARAAGAIEPRLLAKQLAILKEGAIVTAQVMGSAESARQAGDIAERLIDDAIPAARPEALSA